MKIFTPEIAFHNTQPVLSLDIIKVTDSTFKVITSGADNHIVVWKLVISLDPNSKERVIVEPLAELKRHQKAINIVRFAPNKKVFASGDDEGYIFLWNLDEDGPQKVVNNLEDDDFVNLESWNQFRVLRGHNEDVVDLSWSPSGHYILSGSVDNEAIVWDVEKGTRAFYLAGHNGYIHGVAWDPLNDYLATLSTDRVLRIYNVRTKRIVQKTSKALVRVDEKREMSRLFFDDTLQTFSRRISFTPGGEMLLAPSGIVESKDESGNFKFTNVTHIFLRKSFSEPFCYLPTGKLPTLAVKCCPQRFQCDSNVKDLFQFPYKIVFAVATSENILFYDTQNHAPFGIVSGIHYTRHTDLSWSEDGRILSVSSTDGYCTFIIFQSGEFGPLYTDTVPEGELMELPKWIPFQNNLAPQEVSIKKELPVKKSEQANQDGSPEQKRPLNIISVKRNCSLTQELTVKRKRTDDCPSIIKYLKSCQ